MDAWAHFIGGHMAKDLEARLDAALAGDKAEQCDKCGKRNAQPVVATLACAACGNEYKRCAAHDGEAGCKRSLASHKSLCFWQPLPRKS